MQVCSDVEGKVVGAQANRASLFFFVVAGGCRGLRMKNETMSMMFLGAFSLWGRWLMRMFVHRVGLQDKSEHVFSASDDVWMCVGGCI